jgi:hypothetical protein
MTHAVDEPGAAGRDAAAARGEAARRRAGQLQQRRAELASGLPSDAASVERARLHVIESLERAQQAHRDAAARHLGAGEAHRRAAATHEQAAMLAGDGSGEAHQDAAESHRAAAAVHEAAAIVQAKEADQLFKR